MISSGVEEPGVVRHAGGPARIVFGELDGSASARTAALLEAFSVPGVDAQRTGSIQGGALGQVRLPVRHGGPDGDHPAAAGRRALLSRVLGDTATWSRRCTRAVGVPVAADAVDRTVAFAAGLEPHISASLYHDLVKRRLELDAMHTTVVRLGNRHGVPTPMSAAVEAILRPHAERAVPPS